LTVQQWLNLKKNMAAIEKAYHERSAYSDSDPDDEIVVCDIGSSKDGHKMVCVKSWKKQIRIDIREFYLQDGMRMPGKKGISIHFLSFLLNYMFVMNLSRRVSSLFMKCYDGLFIYFYIR
jgi:hypothetical protein